MTTEIRNSGESITVILSGRLDTLAAIQCEDDIRPAIMKADRNIVLDCSGLEYISSSGIRIFIELLSTTRSMGGSLRVVNMPEDIRQIFIMAGIARRFGL